MVINEIIKINNGAARVTSAKRLANLRQLLADELKSDNPSMKYVEDLKESIKSYES